MIENQNPYQPPEHQASEANLPQTISFRWFRRGFLWWGAVPLFFSLMVLTSDQNPGLFMVLNTAWWLVGLTLVMHSSAGFFTALAMVSGLWLIGGYVTVRRIIFVIENQGMERADGLGSPAAFLIGLIFEQCFLFVPMSILLVLGVATVWTRRS